jgi:sialic acid synthase SpsE
LYFVRDLKAGAKIAMDDIRSVRPGYGLPPKEADQVIGSLVTKDVQFGEAVRWDALKKA